MSIFVTGTDTGVGKTVAAAVLALKLGWNYWKPIQTGSAQGMTDTQWVARFLEPSRIQREAYNLRLPRAPSQAAQAEGIAIDLRRILAAAPEAGTVIEGAGGALVPMNANTLLVDLIQQLQCPVVLVARSSLGTINHSLLALESLRKRGIQRIGILFNGEPDPQDRAEIESFGGAFTVGSLPPLKEFTSETLFWAGKKLKLENLWNESVHS